MKSVLNRIWKSIQRPCFEFAQKSLYLRPELFNGIQIGTIRWKMHAGLAACALMNRQRESGAFVLAVDLPSGINTDTGEAAEGAVRADLTVTFDSSKLRTLLR